MDQAPFLTGQFLLATPGMADPRFSRSVIAMCSHDGNGAMGIGIGAVVGGIGLHDLLGQFAIATDGCVNAPVHYGGPVEQRRGFVLHSRDWDGQDTLDVAGRWKLSASVDVLRAIAGGTGPRHWLVALGYAGWGAGQLDAELAGAGWVNVAGEGSLMWDTPADERWTRGFAGAGIDPRLLVGAVGSA